MANLLGGGGPLGAVSGLTGGGGPLNAVSGIAGGDSGPLGAVSGLTQGAGPLGAVSGLTDGLAGGGGGPLDSVTGLAGGLLGGGEGLNLVGLVGVGSDDDALLDLNPAEKKKVKAQKAAAAKQNEKKRQEAYRKLQEQVKAQGGQASPQQQELARQLQESQQAENAQMQKYEQVLGPTDPELLRQAETGELSSTSSGPSSGLFFAYLVNAQTFQPTHLLTFPNASAASKWQQMNSGSVEKASDQMYVYAGYPPQPSGRMGCMSINTVQPIIPLQRGDGYPICCKSGSGAGSASGSAGRAPTGNYQPTSSGSYGQQQGGYQPMSNGSYGQQQGGYQPMSNGSYGNSGQTMTNGSYGNGNSSQPVMNGAGPGYNPAAYQPQRKRLTFADAANSYADSASSRGDYRPRQQIVQEAMEDLKANCATAGPCNPQQGNGNYAANPAGGPLGGPLGGLPTGALPTSGFPLGGGDSGGGDLLGGLLGSGQGLNVAGLVGIGSDDPALLDLSPAEKKAAKLKKQQELQKQQQIQNQQIQALQQEIQKNNGRQTPQQQAQLKELQQRRQALNQASSQLDDSMKKDDAAGPIDGLTKNLPTGALPTDSLTSGLPTNDLTKSLPTQGLPTSGLTKGLGL